MGRIKKFLIGMENDAFNMSRDDFIAKHGKDHVDIFDGCWDEINYESSVHSLLSQIDKRKEN